MPVHFQFNNDAGSIDYSRILPMRAGSISGCTFPQQVISEVALWSMSSRTCHYRHQYPCISAAWYHTSCVQCCACSAYTPDPLLALPSTTPYVFDPLDPHRLQLFFSVAILAQAVGNGLAPSCSLVVPSTFCLSTNPRCVVLCSSRLGSTA